MGQQLGVAATIVPVFLVIAVGWIARRRGLLPRQLAAAANRLVYFIALPALVFRVTSRASGPLTWDPAVLGTVLTVVTVFGVAWGISTLAGFGRALRPTFVQSSFHCNVGFVGLAVAALCLSSEGLATAAMLAGWMILVQNMLAVVGLRVVRRGSSAPREPGISRAIASMFANPIIVACVAGATASRLAVELHPLVDRTVDLLSGLAIPLALLVIGASLRFRMPREFAPGVALASLLKLVLMPAIGLAALKAQGLPPASWAPGIILLASPTAVMTHTMAEELGGDSDFAVTAVSTSTLLSMITLSAWLAALELP